MAEFFLLPTTDIHLVLNANIPAGNKFILKFRTKNRAPFTPNLVIHSEFDSSIISVTKNLNDQNPHYLIEALSPGETFIRIVNDGQQECIVRVWVHTGIDFLSINNDHLTIYRGNEFPGYVASVFAKFTSDDELGDITYHPYLNYTDVSNYLTISDHIIKSTVPDSEPELQTLLNISIGTTNPIQKSVPVTIKKGFVVEREILEKVYIGGSPLDHFNLLILGDGFKNKKDFEIYRNELIAKLTGDPMFSPWNSIMGNFTIWSAFDPTFDSKEGITVNNPVSTINDAMPDFYGDGTEKRGLPYLNVGRLIDKVGIPQKNSPQSYQDALIAWYSKGVTNSNLTIQTFNEWKKYNSIKGYIENKDTVLGITIGNRLGDNVGSKFVDSPPRPLNNWYQPYAAEQRNLQFDRRRYPQDEHKPAAERNSYLGFDPNGDLIYLETGPFDLYLGSLKYVNPIDPQDREEYDKGKTWQLLGKDSKLIAILANHDKWGGSQILSGKEMTFPNGDIKKIISRTIVASLTGRKKYNISTDPNNQLKLFDNINAANNFLNYDSLKSVGLFSHELMHAFGLADEYEGNSYTQMPTENQAKKNVDIDANVMSIYKVKLDNTSPASKFIDADEIKWNLPRVALSSMIIIDASRSGSTITVKLELNQSPKWKKVLEYKDANNNPVTLPLYIRSSVYDENEDGLFYKIAIERLISVDTSNETVVMEVDNTELNRLDITKLKKGSHIFLPKRLSDNYDPSKVELNIINPRVLQYLRLNKRPFAINSDCSIGTNSPEFPEQDNKINLQTPQPVSPSTIIYPDFSSPKNRFLVTGIYEGADGWNCGVYRANGWSILRAHTLSFRNVTANSNEITDPDVTYTTGMNIYETAYYGRFDFFAKYYAIVIAYPTKLEDLDRYEYQDTDSTIL